MHGGGEALQHSTRRSSLHKKMPRHPIRTPQELEKGDNTLSLSLFFFLKELWCHLALFFNIAACRQEDSVARETAAKVHRAAAHSEAGKCLLASGEPTEAAPSQDAMQAAVRQAAAPPPPGSPLTLLPTEEDGVEQHLFICLIIKEALLFLKFSFQMAAISRIMVAIYNNLFETRV